LGICTHLGWRLGAHHLRDEKALVVVLLLPLREALLLGHTPHDL
jgi:hypothetical protein